MELKSLVDSYIFKPFVGTILYIGITVWLHTIFYIMYTTNWKEYITCSDEGQFSLDKGIFGIYWIFIFVMKLK